jgi:Ca2+-binding EF-hand superfamily protein
MLFLVTSSSVQAASPSETIEEHFTRTDRNADGRLTPDEMPGVSWLQYDTDGDRAVTRDEFAMGRTRDKREAETTADTARAWKLLDWNHDNYLSGFELDNKWDRFDADGDGKVQQAEFLAARGQSNPAPAKPALRPGDAVIVPGNVAQPAGAQTSLWGQSLKTAKAADLFKFFNLVESGAPILLEAGTQQAYQPKQGEFRELVMVKLTVSRNDKIVAAELLIAGKFVRDPAKGIFARDIAKSFLAQLTPAGKQAEIRDLYNELAYGAPGLKFVGDFQPPALPNPSTPGYLTYLGKKESHEQRLGDAQLLILSAVEDDWLLISFQPASEETN